MENPTRTFRNQNNLSRTNEQNHSSVLVRPCIVGYMSVDASRTYCSDLSQLKFITSIPTNKLSWDLNHNIEQAVKRTTDDNDEKIDLLLKFLLDQRGRFNLPSNTFITYRYTLINVMYSAFYVTEPVCIRACLYKDNIYLDEINPALQIRRQTFSDQEKAFCAWGYKFEQYMSSDHPALAPNIEKPVVENAEFSLIFCSQIEDHKLFYGAQVDGLLATGPTPPPPNTEDVQEIINYLRQHHYVELKTNKEIITQRQENNFKRYKLFNCWGQCYLADYKGLLVGFRNDSGIIQRLQWFDTAEIPKYCTREWDPQTALNFLNYFLTFVKKTFSSYNCENNSNSPLTLDFYIDFDRTIKVEHCSNHATLLPDWYIQGTR